MGLGQELDIAKGFGQQLRSLLPATEQTATRGRGFWTRVKEYQGETGKPSYRVVFEDINNENPARPGSRKRQITDLRVFGKQPEGSLLHVLALESDYGFPVVRMRLHMVDDNLAGLVRESLTQRDVQVLLHDIDPESGEYRWIELNYQVDRQRPHVAQLVSGGLVIQRTIVHAVEKGTVHLPDATEGFYGVKGAGYGDPTPLTQDELIARGAIAEIDWLATAGMYLTSEMPDGHDLDAQAIYESPVVIA